MYSSGVYLDPGGGANVVPARLAHGQFLHGLDDTLGFVLACSVGLEALFMVVFEDAHDLGAHCHLRVCVFCVSFEDEAHYIPF